MCVDGTKLNGKNYKNHSNAFRSIFMLFFLLSKFSFTFCFSRSTAEERDVFLSSDFPQLPASPSRHSKHIFLKKEEQARGPAEPLKIKTRIRCWEKEKDLLVFVAAFFPKRFFFRKQNLFLRAHNTSSVCGTTSEMHVSTGYWLEGQRFFSSRTPKCAVSHSPPTQPQPKLFSRLFFPPPSGKKF